MVLTTMVSCTGTDDIHIPDDGKGDYISPDGNVTRLHEHTKGAGFSIVIMGDGYTEKDIVDGTYRNVTTRALNAVFDREPMASLKELCDVYEVTAVSQEEGVTNKKRNTAFGTSIPGNGTTDVYGDSTKVMQYAMKALGNSYEKLNKVLTIVVLNSSEYAGLTLLALDSTVTDSIPSGFSLSYVPAIPTNNGKDVFELLIQHEAVGHGIGKLADEYFYLTTATTGDINKYRTLRKYGMFMNTSYAEEETGTIYQKVYDKKTSELLFDLYKHDIEDYSFMYPLLSLPQYADEDLAWYEGGYVFPKHFYRPTLNSMMNETLNANKFNVPSRLMIYKRVMREAYGKTFSCDLTKTEDLEKFTEFDSNFIKSNGNVLQAKGISHETLPEMPLSAPKIINIISK